MWAAGCVLAELLRGAPLFTGTSEIGHLCKVIELLGAPTVENWPVSVSAWLHGCVAAWLRGCVL